MKLFEMSWHENASQQAPTSIVKSESNTITIENNMLNILCNLITADTVNSSDNNNTN